MPPLSEEMPYPKKKSAPFAAERISHLLGGRLGSIIDCLSIELRVLYFQEIIVWLELYRANMVWRQFGDMRRLRTIYKVQL